MLLTKLRLVLETKHRGETISSASCKSENKQRCSSCFHPFFGSFGTLENILLRFEAVAALQALSIQELMSHDASVCDWDIKESPGPHLSIGFFVNDASFKICFGHFPCFHSAQCGHSSLSCLLREIHKHGAQTALFASHLPPFPACKCQGAAPL